MLWLREGRVKDDTQLSALTWMVVPTFTKKRETREGKNFKVEIVILALDMLSLSCLFDSLVQIFSTSYKCKPAFTCNVWTGGVHSFRNCHIGLITEVVGWTQLFGHGYKMRKEFYLRLRERDGRLEKQQTEEEKGKGRRHMPFSRNLDFS